MRIAFPLLIMIIGQLISIPEIVRQFLFKAMDVEAFIIGVSLWVFAYGYLFLINYEEVLNERD